MLIDENVVKHNSYAFLDKNGPYRNFIIILAVEYQKKTVPGPLPLDYLK